MTIIYASLVASDWITLFSALATLMISIISGLYFIKFNKWNKAKEEAAELDKQEERLEQLNRQFQTDIFQINSDISKESIHVLEESFRSSIAKTKAMTKFTKRSKESDVEIQQRTYRSRLELSSLLDKHIYKFKNILREKEMLITQYYKNKIVNDEYRKLYDNTDDDIVYKCNVCQTVFDLSYEWSNYLRLASTFTKEIKDIKNIDIDFTRQLEDFVDESNKLEQLIGYGVVLSKNYKFYLKDEFIMFHNDCEK